MESINTLFLLTAGVLAVVGTVLFIMGLILETPLKYVFFMMAFISFIGKFILPPKTYIQARKEGIVWLTVLNNGDLEQARKDHNQGVENSRKFVFSDSDDEQVYIYEGDGDE